MDMLRLLGAAALVLADLGAIAWLIVVALNP